MPKKRFNEEKIEGRVYQHDLVIKTVQSKDSKNYGKQFISGTLQIATDEEGLNVIPVHFTCIFSDGNRAATYTALDNIIKYGKAWVVDGKDVATKVRISASIKLNDFYGRDGQLVSVKVNEGSFVNIVTDLCSEDQRNTFSVDMLITKITKMEPEGSPEYVVLRGAIFNYKNDILPVDFTVRSSSGIEYFENLDATPKTPVFTKVSGVINSTTVIIERSEESAFGEPAIKTYERKTKEWMVTFAAKVPYEYGDEDVLTEEEVTKALQDREVYLADIKKRAEEYRNNSSQVATTPTVATGGFNF